jgi:aspartyl-tRNA(Asn)/glutamyl-tRNA(Gln) amidotransferase subunit A
MPPIGEPPQLADLSCLRVAFSPTLGYGRVDPPVAELVAGAVERLMTVFPNIELVDDVCAEEGAILAAEFIGGCSARLGDAVDRTPDLIDPPLLAAIRAFRATSTDGFTRLLRRRQHYRETMRQFFERYDILITPTVPCIAWDIDSSSPPGHEDASVWSYFTYPFNLTGQPAGSLPCGLSSEGLPVGLQIVAPLSCEARLLGTMRVVEAVLRPACATPIEPRATAAGIQHA